LTTLSERFGTRLPTYVLMPNHYHLQIETPRLNLNEAIDWDRIIAVIEKLWGEAWEEISQRYGDPESELAILIVRRYGGRSLLQIGDAVGGLRYLAVSDAVRRTSARLETDRALDKRIKKLCKIWKL
jgi:hypothetical protein